MLERTYNNVPEATQTEADGVIDRRWHFRERPGLKFEPPIKNLGPGGIIKLSVETWRFTFYSCCGVRSGYLERILCENGLHAKNSDNCKENRLHFG